MCVCVLPGNTYPFFLHSQLLSSYVQSKRFDSQSLIPLVCVCNAVVVVVVTYASQPASSSKLLR